ncbi:MAG: hypothetical protein M5U12_18150 [Verrucomicrobia bacterium]|nr:hypothetical protein [Verrucomicrobiota bacterium]
MQASRLPRLLAGGAGVPPAAAFVVRAARLHSRGVSPPNLPQAPGRRHPPSPSRPLSGRTAIVAQIVLKFCPETMCPRRQQQAGGPHRTLCFKKHTSGCRSGDLPWSRVNPQPRQTQICLPFAPTDLLTASPCTTFADDRS